MKNSKDLGLEKIKKEIIGLKESPLYKDRKKGDYFPVVGEGNHDADIMFVGEAPGKNEAETGSPFVGAAGKVLDEFLESAGLKRGDVYITNIVKDRPPNNRDPLPAEIELYAPFLDRQINIIKPKVIATLGRFSSAYVLKKFDLGDRIEPMSEMHGKKLSATTDYGKVVIVPLYHPAAALYRRDKKEEMRKDFKKLTKL